MSFIPPFLSHIAMELFGLTSVTYRWGLNSYLFLLIYMVYENYSNSFGCINLFQNELPSPSPVWFCQFETEQLFETVMPFESYPLLKVSCISLCYCSLIKGLHSALWALLPVIDFVTVNANHTEEWKNAYYHLLVVIVFYMFAYLMVCEKQLRDISLWKEWCALKRARFGKETEWTVYLELVYLVTALVPSDTACLANSPGRSRRTAVWISRLVMVERRL